MAIFYVVTFEIKREKEEEYVKLQEEMCRYACRRPDLFVELFEFEKEEDFKVERENSKR